MIIKKRTYQINCIVFKRMGKDIKFLLLKRNPQKGGFWQPITGGARPDEDKIKVLKRELREETGIKKIQKIIDTKYSFSFIDENGNKLKEYVYGVEIDPNQKITLSKEHTKEKWVSLKEALKLLKYESNKKGLKVLFDIIKNGKN